MKDDATPVTIADRRAEEIMREEIAHAFPTHGIIGEEYGEHRVDAEYVWVLDPIDGTRAFAAGSPLFGTLISLCRGGVPQWGVINLPVTGCLYMGNNRQAWRNGRLIRARETASLADCLVLISDPKSPYQCQCGAGWDALLAATGHYRSWGDCFGHALVAQGTADIMCDPTLKWWDIAALLPVLRGAGAAVSDWHGGDPVGASSLVACHPRHHATVLGLLRGGGI
jgi:myo-inositol-1(or 4)-monophosphatase